MPSIFPVLAIVLMHAAALALGDDRLLFKAPYLEEAQSAFSDTGAEDPGISPPFIVQEIATPFSLPTRAIVSQIAWAGYYYLPPKSVPGDIQFRVRLFANLARGPASLPFYDASVTASAETSRIVASFQTYSLIAHLSPPMQIQPNTVYWLSLVENDPATTRAFRWFESTEPWAGRQYAFRFSDSGAWSGALSGPSYNFALFGISFPMGVTNLPPNISCPANTILECSTPAEITVVVSDPDGDPLSVIWTINGVNVETNVVGGSISSSLTNVSFLASLPPGTNFVTATAIDPEMNIVSCSTTVTVSDTTPPFIASLEALPAVLWPPNHQMIPVQLRAEVTDACSPATWKIIQVTDNQAGKRVEKAKTEPDWEIIGEQEVKLRAERAGNGRDRIYSIIVQASDGSGNVSQTETVTVIVPHNSPDIGDIKPHNL